MGELFLNTEVFELRAPTNSPFSTTAITRKPILSLRRRIVNTPATSTSANLPANDLTSTEREPSFKYNNRNRSSFTGSNSTPSHQQVKTSNRESYTNIKLKSTLSTNAAESSTSVNEKTNRHNNGTKYSSGVLRRKFQPRRITTTTTLTTNTADSVAELLSTPNPLFKRRLTTVSTIVYPTTTTTIPNTQTTIIPRDIDDTTDQEAKSSIHSSFINQFTELEENNTKLINDHKEKTNIPQTTTNSPQNKFTLKEGITRRMDLEDLSQNKPEKPLNKRPSQRTTAISVPRKNHTNTQVFANRRGTTKNKDAFERLKVPARATTTHPNRRAQIPQQSYDYYDDGYVPFIGNKRDIDIKVVLHGNGIIECLDHGNFPHPLSCRKFISCAKYESGGVVGWEYTCPKGTSYDPVGGMCNWAAGLGCKD